MIYGGDNVSEYLDRIEDDWRKEKLLEIRDILLSYEDLNEGMAYGMLSYGKKDENDEGLFALNAQRNYVSLYIGNIAKVDPEGAILKGLSMGKGCIRLSKTKDVEASGLPEFIKKSVDLWRNGQDTAC